VRGSVRGSKDISIRLVLFAIGFTPIASLCLATFKVLPLDAGGRWIVFPAILGALALGLVFREYAGVLLRGLLVGMAAVFIYDVICRFPFIAIGVWPDFIPRIGNYLLNRENVHWSVGYLWRYLGNGGGMGMAFYAVYPLVEPRVKPLKAGVMYGVSIFCCLLATIYLSPAGKSYLFAPTAGTALLGLLGHIVYGGVLGYGTKLSQNLALEQAVPPVSGHGCVSGDAEVGGDMLLAAHADQCGGDAGR
jgi:hypothetical protein